MIGSEEFKRTIQRYLEYRVETDELFAKSYLKPNKNIDDCITFILNWVKQSECAGFTDDEIYSLATHYYDEDNIVIGKPISNCNVIVNHRVELSEAEINMAKREAVRHVENDAYRALKKRQEKRRKKSEDVQQLSLF